jgi:hypothetical protein
MLPRGQAQPQAVGRQKAELMRKASGMMAILTGEQIQIARMFVFKNGRLLERQLFEYFFGDGTKQACLKALSAYQNEDGGFGNGLEPDILCPASSGIGAETAMYILELLGCQDSAMANSLAQWIIANQNMAGVIDHPPMNFTKYPYQSWWQKPDAERVLTLAGLMKKWGIGPAAFLEKVRSWFLTVKMPDGISFYDYPYFVYLKYCSASTVDREQFSKMVAGIPGLLKKHRDHFPLFNRAWHHACDYVDKEVLAQEAAGFVNAIHADGDIDSPYPELPSWNPIFLLDGLILLKQVGFL